MNITEVQVKLVKGNQALKGIASFVIYNSFIIRGVRIMEDKRNHIFVTFPSREKANGEYEDVVFPLTRELYIEITNYIISAYKKQIDKEQIKGEQNEIN